MIRHTGIADSAAKRATFAMVIILTLSLAGCATCRNHPIACTVATAVVAGSIAASVQHHHDDNRQQPKYPCDPQAGIIGTCVGK